MSKNIKTVEEALNMNRKNNEIYKQKVENENKEKLEKLKQEEKLAKEYYEKINFEREERERKIEEFNVTQKLFELESKKGN